MAAEQSEEIDQPPALRGKQKVLLATAIMLFFVFAFIVLLSMDPLSPA